jgi:hypothetical protein
VGSASRLPISDPFALGPFPFGLLPLRPFLLKPFPLYLLLLDPFSLVYGVVAGRLQVGDLSVELGAGGLELVEVLFGAVGVEGLQEAVGVAVEGLPGKALVVGEAGDGAVGPVQDGSGVGDAALGG